VKKELRLTNDTENRITNEAKFSALTAHGAWKRAPEREGWGEATLV
jgi:hypothetical protein